MSLHMYAIAVPDSRSTRPDDGGAGLVCRSSRLWSRRGGGIIMARHGRHGIPHRAIEAPCEPPSAGRDGPAADRGPEPDGRRRGGQRPAGGDCSRPTGSRVERIAAGHPTAPAVSVRFDSGRPGPTLQFDGHLDTVHLPFVAARGRGRPAHRQRRLGHEGGDRRGRRGAPRAAGCRRALPPARSCSRPTTCTRPPGATAASSTG